MEGLTLEDVTINLNFTISRALNKNGLKKPQMLKIVPQFYTGAETKQTNMNVCNYLQSKTGKVNHKGKQPGSRPGQSMGNTEENQKA